MAGALLGYLHAGLSEGDARREALALACELEHQPDNAAASMLGGIVASSGGHSVRVPMALDVAVIVWSPAVETSTNKSRAALPASIPFADAVFNVGRTALLVAALAAGDRAALGVATEDRMHQDARLALSPLSARAIEAVRGAEPIAVWLSGSGPTVAAFVEPGDVDRVSAVLPDGGVTRVLRIDSIGAQLLDQ